MAKEQEACTERPLHKDYCNNSSPVQPLNGRAVQLYDESRKTEEDCSRLVKLLPPAEATLLEWAVNLNADVVQEEQLNMMNAPNMLQMPDPLNALMYAVKVMNFLRTLIQKTLGERQGNALTNSSVQNTDPYDHHDNQNSHLDLEAFENE